MSKVRGLPDFETLWNRRTTVEIEHKVIDIAGLDPERCRLLSEDRPLLSHAAGGDESRLAAALWAEEDAEHSKENGATQQAEMDKARAKRLSKVIFLLQDCFREC